MVRREIIMKRNRICSSTSTANSAISHRWKLYTEQSLRWVLCFALMLAFYGPSCYAQETRVPMDEGGKIVTLTEETAANLLMFRDLTDFRSAQLFQVNDSLYVLEIEYGEGNAIARNRTAMNTEEMLAFRREVSTRIQSFGPNLMRNHEGRTTLVVGVSSLAVGFYSWAIPASLEIEDSEAFTLMYLLISGAGYIVPSLITERSDVTSGMATLGLNGGGHGIADGFFLSSLFTDDAGDLEAEDILGTMALTSIGELIAGSAIASSSNMSAGKAMVVSSAGWFGSGIGLATFLMSEPDKLNRMGGALWLAGTAGGYIAGNALATDQSYTTGDAQILTVTGVLGATVPTALLSLEHKKGADIKPVAYWGTAIAGTIGGFWLGHTLTRGRDFSSSQGTLVTVGTAGGALTGMGIGFLLASSDEDWKIPVVAAAVGGAAMFGVMYYEFSESARISAETSGTASAWNVQISPLGIAAVAGCGGLGEMPVPVASIQYKW